MTILRSQRALCPKECDLYSLFVYDRAAFVSPWTILGAVTVIVEIVPAIARAGGQANGFGLHAIPLWHHNDVGSLQNEVS
jgi:hypothetical protein